MPHLIPLVSVGVSRKVSGGKNKTIWPPMGKLFEFTDEEVAHIRAAHPGVAALRRPVNEAAPVAAAVAENDPEVTSDDNDAADETAAAKPLTAAQRRAKARQAADDEDSL